MKRTIPVDCLKAILLIISLTSAHIACAQKFAIGIKAGATVSISSFGDKEDNDTYSSLWKPGYFGAALINFPLKDNFSFQTEAGFSKRGRKIKFNEATWSNNASYQFLDASMLLRKSYPLKWSKNIKGTWFFNVGPKVSYWLKGKGTITSGGSYNYDLNFSTQPDNPGLPDFNVMYMTDVNRWLFGIDFGIGLDAPTLALQRFIIEVRFTSGHTFYGEKDSAFNRTLGFNDNLRANEKIFSFSVDYALNREVRGGLKGGSTKSKGSKKPKPRKSIDSLLR